MLHKVVRADTQFRLVGFLRLLSSIARAYMST